MRWSVHALSALAMLHAGLLAGCRSATDGAYPPDPLFLSKKPAEKTTAHSVPILFAAVADPAPPAFPATVIAAPSGDQTSPQRIPGTLAAVSKGEAMSATPAIRSPEPVSAPAALAEYDQARDGRWLQGVLEKHYLGYYDLRYAAPSAIDPTGGKVRLENDPRLQSFHDGDEVRIEGVLVPELDIAAPSTRTEYPHYQIRTIRLVRPSRLQADATTPHIGAPSNSVR